jgi:uncharacterized protein (DUF1330 family)
MDIFDEELLNFWRSLNKFGVRYIMVGGVATNLNGYHRTTDDIDVWIEDTVQNRENYRKAYKEYSGIDITMMNRLQIIPGWTNFNLNNGFRLDLLVSMKGLEEISFEDCYRLSNKANIDDVIIPFLHINHLIANKKAVNRSKDQTDVIELERIKKYLEENKNQK